MDRQFIFLLHIFFVGPLLLYTYHIGNNLSLRNKDLEYLQVFQIIGLIGLIIILYHGYQLLQYKGYI
tara:strand:+ start:3037 stop:3237 length:201 start_codon:yes stop_codon:yes gene_type:complete